MQSRYEDAFGKFFRIEQLILSTLPDPDVSDGPGQGSGRDNRRSHSSPPIVSNHTIEVH